MEESMDHPLLSYSSLSPPLIKRMYMGHFLARWGARMWEFSVGLYMINIWPDSLLFTAVYGVVEAASTALFGPLIGKLVNQLTYIQVLRLWLLTQNLSFLVAGGTVIALLVCDGFRFSAPTVFMLLVAVTNISGAVGVLSTLAGTILIERECESSQRRITKHVRTRSLESASAIEENESSRLVLETSGWKRRISGRLSKLPCFDAWIVYAKQEIVLPGVALALLFFTVLRSVS
ncbi:solute carrier family 40 member 1 isoform X2 [Asparagus officinalis]|uniref:solute carrier family 40 member 1 isoform X2 n=1 Tax=Asparagus officinalis TaxID=4686 RepID=UPI00098DEAA2|nr:solute carrier family 40 member 1 isoform X2 [Asparagus officinalis]